VGSIHRRPDGLVRAVAGLASNRSSCRAAVHYGLRFGAERVIMFKDRIERSGLVRNCGSKGVLT